MSRRCDLTGKDVMTGNNVSHSVRRTRRRFLPNIKPISFFSAILNKNYSFDVCMSTLRTIDMQGGFDSFLLNTASSKLTETACKIKKEIQKKLAAA
jgi:large subunit ribosomal protein L28